MDKNKYETLPPSAPRSITRDHGSPRAGSGRNTVKPMSKRDNSAKRKGRPTLVRTYGSDDPFHGVAGLLLTKHGRNVVCHS